MSTMVSEILPGIYVSGDIPAGDRRFFEQFNIRRVVNCTGNIPNHFPDLAIYMNVPVGDLSDGPSNSLMAAAIPRIIRFISDGFPSKQQAILIHCNMGVSRSCTVAAAYVRSCCKMTINDALDFILTKRPQAFFYGKAYNFLPALYHVFKV